MNDVAVRTENLTKRYGRLTAVDNLTLEVRAGEVFGFLGPNGAGKSTTIRLMLGLARPSAGRVWVFGMPPARSRVPMVGWPTSPPTWRCGRT